MSNKNQAFFFIGAFMLAILFCQRAVSGYSQGSVASSAAIIALGAGLLKFQQTQEGDRFIVSWPRDGDQSANAKTGSTESKESTGSRIEESHSAGASAGSGSMSSGSGADGNGGDDEPPRKRKRQDEPQGAYYVAPEEGEGESITIELVSSKPLIFRFRIPKRTLKRKKLNSNTPWVELKSNNGSAYLSLYIGKPDETITDYRILPMLRVGRRAIAPQLDCSHTGNLMREGASHLESMEPVPPVDVVSTMLGVLWCQKNGRFCNPALCFFNTLEESISLTHLINSNPEAPDTLPEASEGFVIHLTHISANTPQSPGLRFICSKQNSFFQAYLPITDNILLADHQLNDHSSMVEDAYVSDVTPLAGCEECQRLAPPDGYVEWRSNWNQAARQEGVLEFHVKVEFKKKAE